jgi:hypothetical protein
MPHVWRRLNEVLRMVALQKFWTRLNDYRSLTVGRAWTS